MCTITVQKDESIVVEVNIVEGLPRYWSNRINMAGVSSGFPGETLQNVDAFNPTLIEETPTENM